jgi:hypothetical protein
VKVNTWWLRQRAIWELESVQCIVKGKVILHWLLFRIFYLNLSWHYTRGVKFLHIKYLHMNTGSWTKIVILSEKSCFFHILYGWHGYSFPKKISVMDVNSIDFMYNVIFTYQQGHWKMGLTFFKSTSTIKAYVEPGLVHITVLKILVNIRHVPFYLIVFLSLFYAVLF